MGRTRVIGVLAVAAILVGCKKKETGTSGDGGTITAGSGAAAGSAPPGCLTRLVSTALPDGDLVLKRDCGPVTIENEVWIDAKLTIEPGVTVQFAPKAALGIGALRPGTLIAQGTVEAPIVFTSAGDKAAGAWDGIHLMRESHESRLENVVIEYAGANAYEFVLEGNGRAHTLKNVTFRAGKGWGVASVGHRSFASIDGCVFEDLSKGAMRLQPVDVPALGTNTFAAGAGVEIKGGPMHESGTLRAGPAGAIYRLVGALDVDRGADQTAMSVLTIEPGVVIEANGDGELNVGTYHAGSLKAVGTADKPIRFTAVDKTKGGWKGIVLGSAAKDVVIRHAVVEYATSDDKMGAIRAGEGAQATIENVSFEHLQGVGLSVRRGATVATGGLKAVDASAAELREAP